MINGRRARALWFATSLAIAGSAVSPSYAFADYVVLRNSDGLTGTIASVSTTEVAMNTELAGRVTVKWTAIARMTATVVARATLSSGQIVEGKPVVVDGRVSLQPSNGAAVPLDFAAIRAFDIADASADEPRWHGSLNAGVDVSRGNAETATISTNGAVTRLGPRDRLALFGTYLFSSVGSGVDAVTTADATRGGARYDHDLAGALYGFGFGDAERDVLQLLDLRTVVGGGAGAHLWKTGDTQLNVFGGVSFARDRYAVGTTTTAGSTITTSSGPAVTPPGLGGTPPGRGGVRPTRGSAPPAIVRTTLSRQVGELLFGQDLSHQLSNSVSLTEAATVFPAIGDAQDYRVSFDLSLSAQLNGWLQWNVTVADRFLNIPPAGGAVQNDTFVSTGLGITLGNGGGSYSGVDGRRPAPVKKP